MRFSLALGDEAVPLPKSHTSAQSGSSSFARPGTRLRRTEYLLFFSAWNTSSSRPLARSIHLLRGPGTVVCGYVWPGHRLACRCSLSALAWETCLNTMRWGWPNDCWRKGGKETKRKRDKARGQEERAETYNVQSTSCRLPRAEWPVLALYPNVLVFLSRCVSVRV